MSDASVGRDGGLRVVVFTGNPALTATPQWRVLLELPGLAANVRVHRLVVDGTPGGVSSGSGPGP